MSQPAASASAVSNGTRQKKRKRVSEAADELSRATQSKKYWFDDGSMILHVEDTLFRVHRSVLSRHSTAFKDVFPSSQPGKSETEKENTFEGCEVAELPGDRVKDWDRVLMVIYNLDPAYTSKDKSIEMVGSMLRLGKKYRFDVIYNEAFQRVRDVFPADLQQWKGYPEEFCGPRPRTQKLFTLMQILLELGNQTLLPSLFYCCSVHVNGAPIIFEFSRTTPGLSTIDPSIAEKLIIGREQISAACSSLHFTWVFNPPVHQTCKDPKQCQSLKHDYLQKFLLDPAPHIALKPTSLVLKRLSGMCRPCRQATREAHDVSRQEMWNRLPSFFGLPAWKDLKDR